MKCRDNKDNSEKNFRKGRHRTIPFGEFNRGLTRQIKHNLFAVLCQGRRLVLLSPSAPSPQSPVFQKMLCSISRVCFDTLRVHTMSVTGLVNMH